MITFLTTALNSLLAMALKKDLMERGAASIGAPGEALLKDQRADEQEQKCHEMLDALPAAIYTTNAEGQITFYNAAAVELSGRRPKLGSDEWCVSWRLYRPDGSFLPHDQCPMALALKEGRAVRGMEAIAERPDGTRVPFIAYPTPLRDEKGALVGAVNMLVDISERKEAEAQQRLLFAELNHRIKNAMQVLQGILNLAYREAGSDEARRALSDVIHRVGAMAAAQTVLYQANNALGYDTKALLEAVCASVGQWFGDRISIRCEAVSRQLSNDTATPLALIVNELITNAAKYGVNSEGEGTILVELTESSGYFKLRIEDEGPGFELTELERRSSGLGLTMALVRQIGGAFCVERAIGARCIVRFRDEAAARTQG